MDGQIFISYRRDDGSSAAGRIYDRLVSYFSSNHIFMDVDNLDLGVDFVEAIEKSVGSCDVLIAVVGRNWLTSSDEEGKRRLDNPEDFVRIEIATAFKRGVRVIPVLVDGASIPRSGDLPDDLKPLVRRNALEVSHTRFKGDCARLIAALERVLEGARAERQEKERVEAEQRETERLEAERREKERAEAEQRETERLQVERLEKERVEAEQREKRLEAERREKERLEAQQREKEPLEAEQRPHEGEERLEGLGPLLETPKGRRILAACAGVATAAVALIVVLSQSHDGSPPGPTPSATPGAAVAYTPALATPAQVVPVTAEEKVNLGVSIPAATHGWTGGVVYWANQAKKELEKAHPGLKVTVKTAGSPPEQANQLQDLLTVTNIDTLVVLPFESASLTKPVAQLKSNGVYVTVVDRGLTDTSVQDAYVAGDNTAFGKVSGEYLAKALNGKGDIVVLRGIPTAIDNERMDGFNSVIKKYPDIKILDAKHGNWNRDDAFKVMQDYLTRFKHIDAVWASDDDMAVGVLKAIEQAKRDDIKIVLGGAGAKGMIKTLIDGKDPLIQANVTYSPKMIYDAIKLTAEARLKGEKVPPTYIIPSVLITKENAKEFYYPDSPF